MKKHCRLSFLLLVSILGVLLASVLGVSAEPVTLTLGSWRVDDVEQVNRLLDAFHQNHPDIR
ncbi:MAG TPA: carbohydrate ABC transporter substrate-binding protein, partial [Limnochordia bacterium]|nr:carbohydrate ABC transporter substrate-binding protein [Limnochordia bacterium]